jgi:hypothetical protein
MRKLVKYANFVAEWERTLAALQANATDFPDATPNSEKLQSVVNGAKLMLQRQAEYVANKQTTSRELAEAIARGRKVATVLRFMIKERYGNRSEKLAEFNLQPFRGRPKAPDLPPSETAVPAEPAAPAGDAQ